MAASHLSMLVAREVGGKDESLSMDVLRAAYVVRL